MFASYFITGLKLHVFLINNGMSQIDDKAWLHNGMCISFCCNGSYSLLFYSNDRRRQLFLSDRVLHLLKILRK